jgi:hypothetical protein
MCQKRIWAMLKKERNMHAKEHEKNIHAKKHEKRKENKDSPYFQNQCKERERERVMYKGVQKLEIFKIPHTCTS